MIIQYDYTKCTGCGLCKLSLDCPNSSLPMEKDEYGFIRPKDFVCISCVKCVVTCPINHIENKPVSPEYKAVVAVDREGCASGGVAWNAYKYIISKGGYGFGVVKDKDRVKYILSNDLKELTKTKNSKYIEPDNLLEMYPMIMDVLNRNIPVLVISTPCVLDAIKRYTNDHKDLYTIDLLCYGWSSTKILNKYKEEQRLIDYIDRASGSAGSTSIGIHEDYSYKIESRNDPMSFAGISQQGYAKRPSCSECLYRTENRLGDLTIGDYWGKKIHHPFLMKEDGVSVVMINNNKGREIYENIVKRIDITLTKEQAYTNNKVNGPGLFTKEKKDFLHNTKTSVRSAINTISKKRDIWLDSMYDGKNYGAIMLSYAAYKYLTSEGVKIYLEKHRRFPIGDLYCNPNVYMECTLEDRHKFANTNVLCGDQAFNYNLKTIFGRKLISDKVNRNMTNLACCVSTGVIHGYFPMTNKEEMNVLLNKLRLYKSIGVREKCTIDLFNTLGIKVEYTPDAAYLLKPEDYNEIIEDENLIERDYVLVYCLDRTPEHYKPLMDAAIDYAYKRNLRVVFVGSQEYSDNLEASHQYLNIKGRTPQEWLWLIKNAHCILTNSYHGTIYALLFNKQFVTLMSDNIFDIRMPEIISTFDISNKITRNTSEILYYLDNPYNTTSVNSKIEELRNITKQWMRVNIINNL